MESISKKCNRCGVEKPLTDYYNCKRDGKQGRCKVCQREMAYTWRAKNPDKMKQIERRYHEKHRVKRNESAVRNYVANKPRRLAQQKAYSRALKDRAYAAYGGYICACCGVTEPAFLSIDHMNNDGHQHRKTVRGSAILHWLRDNNYPPGFQILCMNCQFGRKHCGGVCPHQSARLVCEAA